MSLRGTIPPRTRLARRVCLILTGLIMFAAASFAECAEILIAERPSTKSCGRCFQQPGRGSGNRSQRLTKPFERERSYINPECLKAQEPSNSLSKPLKRHFLRGELLRPSAGFRIETHGDAAAGARQRQRLRRKSSAKPPLKRAKTALWR